MIVGTFLWFRLFIILSFYYNSIIMPSSYTHQFFARTAITLFPREVQDIINEYPYTFYLGALGPDPLYFYGPLKGNPFYSLGDEIHDKGIRKTLLGIQNPGNEEISYLIGYISHYVLDKNCHEYIYAVDKDNRLHHIIEAELDKRLALVEGKGRKISFTSLMKTDECDFSFIKEILQVDSQIYISGVKSMKRLTSLLMTTNPVLRFFTRLCLSLTPRFKKYKDIMFDERTRPELDDIIQELQDRMKKSYTEYVEDVSGFFAYIQGKRKDISFGEDMSFEGKKLEVNV